MRSLYRLFFAGLLLYYLGSMTAGQISQDPPPASQAALDLAIRLIGENGKTPESLGNYQDHINLDLRRGLAEQSNRLMFEHQFADALRGYEMTRQVAEQIGDRRGVAVGFIGIGTIHGRRGEYEDAATALLQGLAISEELNDQREIEVTLNNLGIVRKIQGEYEEAIAYYRRALELTERMARPINAARTLNNIGAVHMLRGSYRDAQQYFQRSLQLKEANQQTADIPGTLANIGDVYQEMGDDDLALEYYERAEKVNEQLGKRADPGILVQIGKAHSRQKRFDRALGYYQRALALHEAAGSQAEIALALQNIGNVRRMRGDLSGAMSDLSRSLDIHERINDRHQAAETLLEIAATQHLRNDLSAALDASRKAVRLSQDVGGRETLLRALVAEGEVLQALGQNDAAGDAYSGAADLVEQLRDEAAGGEQERERFLEARVAPFQRLAGLFAAEGRAAEALEMAERAKARVMLDVLRAGRAEFAVLTLEERERQRQLDRELTAAHARFQAEEAKETRNERLAGPLREAWRKARAAEAEFRTALYAKYPALKLSQGDAAPGSLQDAESIVDDKNTALLEFTVTPAVTLLFVVTRGDAATALTVFTINITGEDLTRLSSHLRQQLAARDLDFEQTSRDLYHRLLAPAEAQLRGRKNLIIVPDGPLWDVPFQTLASRPKHYLIEDAAVSVAPSIAVLRETRAKRARAPSTDKPRLVALGDPSPANGSGERLPETARQVQGLQQLYGTAQSHILVGDAANEERFAELAGNATVLHLATHGVVDDRSPMYSFLLLAGREGADAGRDGRLEAWEIMKMNLHADITVLAACETGRGRVGAGEGVIGLAWAFFLAGSPRTVVSLWKVEDASTTDLMIAFHRQLRIGLTKTPDHPGSAASLRSAALSLLHDSRYRHPFYWAGFVVIGDGS